MGGKKKEKRNMQLSFSKKKFEINSVRAFAD